MVKYVLAVQLFIFCIVKNENKDSFWLVVTANFFLFRIKGVSPKVMKVIQMLRLRKIFSGAFVKINKNSVAMMKIVEPYVAWG